MPEFRIGVCEDIGGYLTVNANSEEEAEKKAIELVEEFGLHDLPKKYNSEVTARNIYNC